MKKHSFREAVLPLLLPAILVGFLYAVAPYMGSWTEAINPVNHLRRLQAGARAIGEPPSLADIQQLETAAKFQEKELVRVRETKRQHEEAWSKLAARINRPKRGSDTTALVLQLLGSHQLELLEQGEAGSKGDARMELPGSLKAVVDQLAEKATGYKPHLIRFRVVGRYLDVIKALEELSDKGRAAVPVSLSMEEGNLKSDRRVWTLLIWI